MQKVAKSWQAVGLVNAIALLQPIGEKTPGGYQRHLYAENSELQSKICSRRQQRLLGPIATFDTNFLLPPFPQWNDWRPGIITWHFSFVQWYITSYHPTLDPRMNCWVAHNYFKGFTIWFSLLHSHTLTMHSVDFLLFVLSYRHNCFEFL